jgi:hypothetical protein
LDWSGYWRVGVEDEDENNEDDDEDHCSFPSDFCFPQLKKFTFSMSKDYEIEFEYGDETWAWLKGLISSIQNVTTIHLNSPEEPEMTYEFLSFLQDSRQLFNNLEGVSIDLERAPEDLLEFLSMTMLPLKKLAIVEDLSVENVAMVQEILNNNCNTLESLQFKLPAISVEWSLRFTSFPKLKELDINFGYEKEVTYKRKGRLLFGNEDDGILDYNRDFPILQSLTLSGMRTSTFAISKYAPFFPSLRQYLKDIDNQNGNEVKPQICTSIRTLNFPIVSEKNECKIMNEIADMFPNVHNKWMNEIRSQLSAKKEMDKNEPGASTKKF